MKHSIFSKNKTTRQEQIFLLLMIVTSLVIGVLLVVCTPNIKLIAHNQLVVLGVILIITGVMFIPSLAWMLFNKDSGDNKNE